jgi:hypothetical protein
MTIRSRPATREYRENFDRAFGKAKREPPRGTFPGDLDRLPSGHTRHCAARMKWGDGECECGVRGSPA